MTSAADPCEIFLGGLPHETLASLPILETALRESLEDFAKTSSSNQADQAEVRLRLHSSVRSEGRCLGYGFAWLPTPLMAKALCEAGELQYQLRGATKMALVRQARGHQQGRSPPPANPMAECLQISCFGDITEELVLGAVKSWETYLRPWSLGLDFRYSRLVDVLSTPPKLPAEGVVVLGLTSTTVDPSWFDQVKELKVPVLLLTEGMELEDIEGLDVRPWPKLALKSEFHDQGSYANCLVFMALRRAVAYHLSQRLKVFVCDCDQTLWGGVVAEDGLMQLDMTGPFGHLQRKVGPPEAEAEATWMVPGHGGGGDR
eukprot:symbB.v1.2.025394.t1/scaffold2448.1/size78896/1